MVIHRFLPQNTGGVQLYTFSLSKELSKEHQVFLFYGGHNPERKGYFVNCGSYDGLPFIEVNKPKMQFEDTYVDQRIDTIYEELLENLGVDVVHFQHLMYLSMNLVSITKRKGIPVVLTLHDFWLICPRWGLRLRQDSTVCHHIVQSDCAGCARNMYPLHDPSLSGRALNHLRNTPGLRRFSRVFSSLLQEKRRPKAYVEAIEERNRYIQEKISDVDLFIAPSSFLRREFVSYGIPEEKIIYSDNGMNLEFLRGVCRKKSDRIRFSFVGNLLAYKGVHVLIEAFNLLNSQQAVLNIYGDQTIQPDYSAMLVRLRRNPNIFFRGGFEHSKIKAIMSETDVLIIPSICFENSPLVIHEAFASGIPVIASNHGGMADLVKHGVDGLVFEPGNPVDLRDKINMLIADPELLRKLEKGIPSIKTVEEDAGEMVGRYQELLERKAISV